MPNDDKSGMTSNSDRQELATLSEVAEALRVASSDDTDELREWRLLRTAVRLGDTDENRIAGFILQHLLPLCAVDPPDGDAEA